MQPFPFRRERFLHDLLNQNTDTMESICARMDNFMCRFPVDRYYTAVIEINTVRNLAEKFAISEIYLFKSSIVDMAEEFLDGGRKGFAVEMQDNKVALAYHAAKGR